LFFLFAKLEVHLIIPFFHKVDDFHFFLETHIFEKLV